MKQNKYTTPDLTVFERNFEGYNVPEKLRETSMAIMRRFVMTGICDGMYIANVIADESGLGDGQSHFNGGDGEFNVKASADFLLRAYGCNIDNREDLEEIIATGTLPRNRMREGLLSELRKFKAEKKVCDEYRRPYAQRQINYSKALLGTV